MTDFNKDGQDDGTQLKAWGRAHITALVVIAAAVVVAIVWKLFF